MIKNEMPLCFRKLFNAKIGTVGSIRQIIIVSFGFAVLLTGCAVPKHAGVFTATRVDGGGFEDISRDHQRHYVRVTNQVGRAGKHGGQAEHRHSFHHVHDFILNETEDMFKPLGATPSRASSKTHKHKIETNAQKPTLTVPHANEYTHINWGLYEKKKFGTCIPLDSIIGFVGDDIPPGWTVVSGMKTVYIRISVEDERDQYIQFQSNHAHSVAHNHQFTVYKPVISAGTSSKTFRPEVNGQQTVVPIMHGHHITDAKTEDDQISSIQSPALSFFKMKFIRANDDHYKVPRGAVMVYFGNDEPRGWRRSDLLAVESVVDKFLMVADVDEVSAVQSQAAKHDHSYSHQHPLKTGEPVDSDVRKTRQGVNDPISKHGHTHEKVIQLNDKTSSAYHLPLYVEVHLIIKI